MRGEMRSHRARAELAKRQHGVASGQQLRALGYSEDTIAREATTGRLHRLHRDVYAIGHASVSQRGECLAAVLASGDGALLSHRSAAWLWGLSTRRAAPAEVTASSPRAQRGDIRIHSAQALAHVDRTSVDGIPVTAIPRTLLDVAAIDHRSLRWLLDSAERSGLLDFGALDTLLRRSRGFRGVARLRDALEAFRIPAFTRSGLERRFVALVKDAGLPMPSMNRFVDGFELDAYWPRERFAVELDTYDYHGTPSAFEADRLRQEDLKLLGIELTRITGKRLDREPEAVVARLRRLLSQRRRDLQAPRPAPPPR